MRFKRDSDASLYEDREKKVKRDCIYGRLRGRFKYGRREQ